MNVIILCLFSTPDFQKLDNIWNLDTIIKWN